MQELPRKIKKREAELTPRVIAWFEKYWAKSVAVEVKRKGGRLKEHQSAALNEVARGTFKHKLADTGRRQPFDFFILKKADAFLVVCEDYKCQVFPHDGKTKAFDIII